MQISIIKIIHFYEVFLTYTHLNEHERDYFEQLLKRAKRIKKAGKRTVTWDEFHAF